VRDDGLTDDEGIVMDALCDALGVYAELPSEHPDDLRDFADSIHRLQDLLAVRVCRRVYPDGWVNYGG
jgi:hypothetical protein